jgi:hypothetical protein
MVDDLSPPGASGEAEALRRLSAFRERLRPELGAAFDALAERLELFREKGREGYFSHPMALPVLEFPQWAAARARHQGIVIGPEAEANLVEAAAVGYLHVRVQDDWFDEAVGEPGTTMLLADAFFTRHHALLAHEVPGTSPFWKLFEEVWLGYGDAMLLERRLHRGDEPYDTAAFRNVLARSRPLVLSPAAVLFAAGQPDDEDLTILEEFSAALVAAHQLFADLLDAEKDRSNQNRTYVLFCLRDLAGGSNEAEALHIAMFSRGGFDIIVQEALDELARARHAAEILDIPEAVRFCDQRAQFMTELQERIYETFFSSLLS